jgi:hypothetical protein
MIAAANGSVFPVIGENVLTAGAGTTACRGSTAGVNSVGGIDCGSGGGGARSWSSVATSSTGSTTWLLFGSTGAFLVERLRYGLISSGECAVASTH